MRILLGLLIFAVSTPVLAQEAPRRHQKTKVARVGEETRSNFLGIDGGPLAAGGAGVVYEHAVLSQWTLGALYSFTGLSGPRNSSGWSVEESGSMYGIRSRLFLLKAADQQGPFLGAALVHVDLATKAKPAIGTSGEAKASETGYQLGGGWQFIGRRLDSGSIVLSGGAYYGLWHHYRWSGDYSMGAPAAEVKNGIDESLFFEMILGYMF